MRSTSYGILMDQDHTKGQSGAALGWRVRGQSQTNVQLMIYTSRLVSLGKLVPCGSWWLQVLIRMLVSSPGACSF